MIKNNSKILCIFAHHDDHIIFGWPVIQKNNKHVHLVTVANEYEEIVEASCKNIGVEYEGSCNMKNGFSQPNRNMDGKIVCPNNYQVIRKRIERIVFKLKPDLIFCHNPLGEYGHYDHRMVFEICYNEFKLPLLITDITARSSYYEYHKNITKTYKDFYNNNKGWMAYQVEPDVEFYEEQKELFEKYNAWSTNQYLNLPIYPRRAKVYFVI